VEKGLDARELEVAALGGDDPFISVVGEILVGGEFYDFNDKYIDGKSSTKIPADIPASIARQIHRHAREAYRSLDTYGMARIDFFLERYTGTIYLNEINLIPGFTNISMYPKLMEASGILYEELLTRLIDLAMARHHQRQSKQRGYESGTTWYA
jgi:D-alanine-D-alanine ligase